MHAADPGAGPGEVVAHIRAPTLPAMATTATPNGDAFA